MCKQGSKETAVPAAGPVLTGERPKGRTKMQVTVDDGQLATWKVFTLEVVVQPYCEHLNITGGRAFHLNLVHVGLHATGF